MILLFIIISILESMLPIFTITCPPNDMHQLDLSSKVLFINIKPLTFYGAYPYYVLMPHLNEY
jgi:hypothetical protein